MTEWQQRFRHARTGRVSHSLREIYRECSEGERLLSAEFVARYLAGRGTGPLTPFAGILQEPGPLAFGTRLVLGAAKDEGGHAGDRALRLEAGLSDALGRALVRVPGKQVDVAVSGGVDSWLLAALLKRLGYEVCGWYLDTGVAGYCERQEVERASYALGIRCRYVPASVDDFVRAVPEFTAATQWPIYNLHPVSKLLLANALQAEGVTTVVTGDAADQVMRWDWDCDLLPLTLACFRHAGIRMVAPFMADEVIRLCTRPCVGKEPVRELARLLGVPVTAKHPTLFPAVALPATPRAALPLAEAREELDADRIACLAYSTGLLRQTLEELEACAR